MIYENDYGDCYWYESDKDVEPWLIPSYYLKLDDKYYKIHREDGPAIKFKGGGDRYIQNGELYRDDGPSYVSNDGGVLWIIKNKNITESVNKWIEENNYPHWSKWSDIIKLHFKLSFL